MSSKTPNEQPQDRVTEDPETRPTHEARMPDPLTVSDDKTKKTNVRRAGSVRPNALMYTGGIGATIDLPNITVMPQGIDTWQSAYDAMEGGPELVDEPRLLRVVRTQPNLGSVEQLRRPPWAEPEIGKAPRVGLPTVVFPAWLRCTACDALGPYRNDGHGDFAYVNTNPFRPDLAHFEHLHCPRRGKRKDNPKAVPARYLVACENGHLDEFPYAAFVHGAQGGHWECSARPGEENPTVPLRMVEFTSNMGPQVIIECQACNRRRSMREFMSGSQSHRQEVLPACRGRHPHLGTFETCEAQTHLLVLGAANQWFSSTVSLVVVPPTEERPLQEVVDQLAAVGEPVLDLLVGAQQFDAVRTQLKGKGIDISDVSDDQIVKAADVLAGRAEPPLALPESYTHEDLLIPEWRTLIEPERFDRDAPRQGFRVHRESRPKGFEGLIADIVGVDRLEKVVAFTGFTRIDSLDRIEDTDVRLAPIGRGRPQWAPAIQERGEGVFIRFDEERVVRWEQSILDTPLWGAHRRAYANNRKRRTSSSGGKDLPIPSPRYWALHTFAHLLIRQLAYEAGYGSASLTERVYAWSGDDVREPMAGVLIATTSSDSEGTLGGLLELGKPTRLGRMLRSALERAQRCSSDPVCAHRAPEGEEDFLHGAACHFCTFLSETSCERQNRFLDRRFVVPLVAGKWTVPALAEGMPGVR